MKRSAGHKNTHTTQNPIFLGDLLSQSSVVFRIQHTHVPRSFCTKTTPRIFIPENQLEPVSADGNAPLHHKYVGRAEGGIFKDVETQAFYLLKLPAAGINLLTRTEYLNSELMKRSLKASKDIVVPEPGMVVSKAYTETDGNKANGYVIERFASRIVPLTRFCKKEEGESYSEMMQDWLKSVHFKPLMPGFLPFVLIQGIDSVGPFFSNLGKEKSTEKLVCMDFGEGSGMGNLRDIPGFERYGVIAMIDYMRFIMGGKLKEALIILLFINQNSK